MFVASVLVFGGVDWYNWFRACRLSGKPCGEDIKVGAGIEEKYLFAPEPPGDCTGRAATGECNPE